MKLLHDRNHDSWFYPIKIKLRSNNKITLYFTKSEARESCYKKILAEQGYANPLEQYEMSQGSLYKDSLGNAEETTVIYGVHRSTKLPVAIKVIFQDIEGSVCISDLPEIAISQKLSDEYHIVRHLEHF